MQAMDSGQLVAACCQVLPPSSPPSPFPFPSSSLTHRQSPSRDGYRNYTPASCFAFSVRGTYLTPMAECRETEPSVSLSITSKSCTAGSAHSGGGGGGIGAVARGTIKTAVRMDMGYKSSQPAMEVIASHPSFLFKARSHCIPPLPPPFPSPSLPFTPLTHLHEAAHWNN